MCLKFLCACFCLGLGLISAWWLLMLFCCGSYSCFTFRILLLIDRCDGCLDRVVF